MRRLVHGSPHCHEAPRKDEPGFAFAEGLDFTIGIASGERQVPATEAGYGPGTGFCQPVGLRAISGSDGGDQRFMLGEPGGSGYALAPQDGSRPVPG